MNRGIGKKPPFEQHLSGFKQSNYPLGPGYSALYHPAFSQLETHHQNFLEEKSYCVSLLFSSTIRHNLHGG
jgi:hypothetical protein